MHMKKKFVTALFLSLALIFFVFIGSIIIVIFNIGNSQTNSAESYLMHSESPDGKYYLEVYRTEPGATVDFSIRVYLISDNNKKEIIYDAYHEHDADVYWLDNSIVSINGRTLDLSRNEKYDWRSG